ncbi:MAG: VOC family protein [Deltaproteobacteria bacterium]|nr:VOC family protein [Deltaproteobacteria bacterium]
MAKLSTYLNFDGRTEAAFEFYRSVFGTDYTSPTMRMGDVPPWPGMPELSAADKAMVMHCALPILGGHVIMGSDTLESMGHKLEVGNNVHLNLEPDSREEADRLFAALSEGGAVTMPMQDMFWGAYYGAFTDKFGIRWMINHTPR